MLELFGPLLTLSAAFSIEALSFESEGILITLLIPFLTSTVFPILYRKQIDALAQSDRIDDPLRKEERFANQIAELSPVVINVFDLETRRDVYISPDVVNLLGYTPKEMAEMEDRFPALWHPEDVVHAREHLTRLRSAADGEISELEYRIRHRDGEWRWMSTRATPFARDEHGDVREIVTATIDITERKRSEEAQHEAEQQYRNIFENAVEGMFQTTPDGGFILANPALARMFGFDSPEELIRERGDISKQHYVVPERREEFKRRLAEEGIVQNFEYEGYRRDGSRIWVSDTVRAVRDSDGTLLHYEGTTQDITERKFVERAQRESQQQYETLVNSVDGIVWEADPQTFNFTFVSKQAEKILGYPLGQWFEGPGFWPDHMHPDDRDAAVAYCVDFTNRRVDHQFEYRMIAADGRVVWLSDIVTVHVAEDQSVLLRGVMVDITERKHIEEKLRQSESQLAEAQHLASVGSWNWDLQQNTHIWSDELYRIYGLDPRKSEPCYKTFMEIVHPDDRAGIPVAFEQAFKTKGPINSYLRIIRPDGVERVIHSRGTAVNDTSGTPIRMHGTVQDVTERKHREAALREAEQKYRDIFENAVEGIFKTSPDGRFVVANPALARMFGFESPEELIRERADISKQHYVDAKRRDEFKRQMEVAGSVIAFEYEAYRKDGTRIWVSENVRAVSDENGKVLYYEGIAEDNTVRKRAQEALRESEERYRELFENAKDATYVHDLGGRYISVNRAAENLSGHSREEIIGRKFSDFVPPGQIEIISEHLCRKLAEQGETTYETEVITNDGRRVPVEVSSHLIYQDGVAVAVQGTARDITERKHAEERLREYEKVVEGIEEMIVVVGCDFRYLLANHAYLKYRGRTREQVVGSVVSEVLGTDLFEGLVKRKLEQCFRGQVVTYDLKATDPLLGARDLLVSLFPIEGATGIDRAACVLKDITERNRADKALRNYSRQLIEAQEAERQHIARELHDQIGQVLTAIKINLQTIGSSDSAESGTLIEQGVDLIDTAIEQVRDLSFELRPSLLDNLGLEAALRWYSDQFTKRTGIMTRSTTNLPAGNTRLRHELETACFRIVQEALTNVVRHAKAKSVSVDLAAVDHQIVISIKDDGVGFDELEQKGAAAIHLGLRGMKDRALALGGTLQILSGPTRGTEIRACFPIASKEDQLL